MRVHLPLQQGLRPAVLAVISAKLIGASASSITTRIKTHFFPKCVFTCPSASASSITTRIKTNKYILHPRFCRSASASSITTRIKTLSSDQPSSGNIPVRVHLPLQQGLRQCLHNRVLAKHKCECIFHYNKD